MAAMLRQARISKCEAFAMGQQERLGAGSQVQSFVQKGVSLGHVGRNQLSPQPALLWFCSARSCGRALRSLGICLL